MKEVNEHTLSPKQMISYSQCNTTEQKYRVSEWLPNNKDAKLTREQGTLGSGATKGMQLCLSIQAARQFTTSTLAKLGTVAPVTC